jgi:proline reductase-associated electron transfer protein PrdC
MKQHVGVPGRTLVNKGDTVKKGQLIAHCEGLGANIHASVYGTVLEANDQYVKISMDDEQPDEYVKIKDTDTNLQAIQEAGVVGAGGAGFPTHAKYKFDLTGGCVIVNAAECEPVLRHNKKVLTDRPEAIVRGLRYAMEITNAAKGYVAIKPKHKQEMIAIGAACKEEPDIELKYLPDMYPAGDERVIIREVLGVELEPGQLPNAANAVVSNVETVKRIVEAIELRKPVITKDFTMGGRLKGTVGGSDKVYLDQPIGASVKKYIDECGGYLPPHGEIVLGGPFTGNRGAEDSVITKTSNGIFVAMPPIEDQNDFGVLACECGAAEDRLKEIVSDMGGTVVAEEKCKRMTEAGGRFRCEKPGVCPGQAETVLNLIAKGARSLLIAACED